MLKRFGKRLGRSPGWRAAGAGAVAAYLRFALATTRWRVEPTPELEGMIAGTPYVFAVWHERLALLPSFWLHAHALRAGRPVRPLSVMVSANRDGQLYAGVLRRLGLTVVHGSRAKGRDQKGGASGLRALLRILQAGGQVALVPDGPRGPPHRAAPGVAQLAGMAGVPVLPVSAQTTRFRRLRSWDRTVLPLPFARGVVVCGAPVPVPRTGWADALPAIEAGLDAAQRRADTLMGLAC